MEKWSGGIVFVDQSQLISTLRHFLAHPNERKAVALEGQKRYHQIQEERLLEEPFMSLVRSVCPNWHPSTHNQTSGSL